MNAGTVRVKGPAALYWTGSVNVSFRKLFTNVTLLQEHNQRALAQSCELILVAIKTVQSCE